jgi:hypothetical protein
MTDAQIPDYPFVVSIYYKDATPDLPALIEYCRPQDFATNPTWHYYFKDIRQVDPFEGLFHCHIWIDVELKQSENWLEDEVTKWALNLIQAGVPDLKRSATAMGSPLEPMSPTDCLQEDDFWDFSKGDPKFCDEDEDEESD